MINNIKKRVFWVIARQRKNFLGKVLFSLSQSLSHALNNKISDSNLNGEYRFLKNLNHSDIHIVFDVGANRGNWTRKFREFNLNAQINAFEPVPETFEKLKLNTKALSHVKTNLAALSDCEEILDFNFYPDKSSWSSAFNHDSNNRSINLKVNCIQGDKYCLENNIQQIDLLKIDTEGFESKVLAGFKKMFENGQIKIVQFEYGPLALESRFLLADFYEFFENYGFEVGKIFPNQIDFRPYSWNMENFILSNFVAVKKDKREMLKND